MSILPKPDEELNFLPEWGQIWILNFGDGMWMGLIFKYPLATGNITPVLPHTRDIYTYICLINRFLNYNFLVLMGYIYLTITLETPLLPQPQPHLLSSTSLILSGSALPLFFSFFFFCDAKITYLDLARREETSPSLTNSYFAASTSVDLPCVKVWFPSSQNSKLSGKA